MEDKSIAPNDVVRYLLDISNKSAYRMSLDLGRSRNYLMSALGRDLHLSTLSSIADVTGHRVAIIPADTDEVLVTIDPPERSPERSPKPKAQGEGEDA